jgi:hypothetical protein
MPQIVIDVAKAAEGLLAADEDALANLSGNLGPASGVLVANPSFAHDGPENPLSLGRDGGSFPKNPLNPTKEQQKKAAKEGATAGARPMSSPLLGAADDGHCNLVLLSASPLNALKSDDSSSRSVAPLTAGEAGPLHRASGDLSTSGGLSQVILQALPPREADEEASKVAFKHLLVFLATLGSFAHGE